MGRAMWHARELLVLSQGQVQDPPERLFCWWVDWNFTCWPYIQTFDNADMFTFGVFLKYSIVYCLVTLVLILAILSNSIAWKKKKRVSRSQSLINYWNLFSSTLSKLMNFRFSTNRLLHFGCNLRLVRMVFGQKFGSLRWHGGGQATRVHQGRHRRTQRVATTTTTKERT